MNIITLMKITFNEKQVEEVAKKILKTATFKTLCFHGEMGAGKTTLIKALVKELGVSSTTSSPTFSIVNEYFSNSGDLMAYHFDFYRLNDETEALDIGLEDYLYSNVWTFIEWPNKIEAYLPQETTNIYLEVLASNNREISIITK